MDRFLCDIPTLEPDENGNIVVISKYSFGPIETITYGITRSGKFYQEWEYPEFEENEQVREYKIISKERILYVLKLEIEKCQNNGNTKLIERYNEAKRIIDNCN